MGYLDAVESEKFEVVHTCAGKTFSPLGSYFKSRGWLLLNGTFILCVPATDPVEHYQTNRIVFDNILSSTWNEGSKKLVINLTDGQTVSMDASGCGCGMGYIANAGPTDQPYTFTRVPSPMWHTNS